MRNSDGFQGGKSGWRGKKKVETFGLFLLPTLPWRTKNRWENYLIATNVNNNFNNFSRLSSSKTFTILALILLLPDVVFPNKNEKREE